MNNREKSEKFLEELGNIDDKFLEEAMNYKKKKISITKIVAAAACVALMIGTIPLVKHFNTPAGTGTTGGVVQGTTGGENALPTVIKLGESGEFDVWESGKHASLPGALQLNAEHNVENRIVLQDKYFTDESLDDSQKTIQIGGNSFIGEYYMSTDSCYFNDDKDTYILKNNMGSAIFEFNRNTGMLIYFNIAELLSPSSNKQLTKDECHAIVIEHLSNYIDDIDEYELTKVTNVRTRDAYEFTFYRTFNGIKLSDSISVCIMKTGDVYTHSFKCYGSMKNVDFNAVNIDKLNNIMGEKVAEIYRNNFELNHELEEITLIRLENDIFFFHCEFNVTGKATSDGGLCQDTCFLQAMIK
ncbi:MAG: hypothetical protein IJW76_07935 [Clostridia bacterium]|nr:hypothetical protein [Clostridia bacterium]